MYRQHRRLLLSSPSNPLRVYTACCGVDLTLAGLRAEGLPYSIVGASEIDPDCRRIFAQCEPELPPSQFYFDAGSPAAAQDSPDCDAFFLTSSCQPFSDANQHVTTESANAALRVLISHASYLAHHSPRFVFIENVTGLQASDRLDILTGFNTNLETVHGRWAWESGIFCPSAFGGPMTRPRIIWVGVLRAYVARPASCAPLPLLFLHLHYYLHTARRTGSFAHLPGHVPSVHSLAHYYPIMLQLINVYPPLPAPPALGLP